MLYFVLLAKSSNNTFLDWQFLLLVFIYNLLMFQNWHFQDDKETMNTFVSWLIVFCCSGPFLSFSV